VLRSLDELGARVRAVEERRRPASAADLRGTAA
jgi:hypothetical protein